MSKNLNSKLPQVRLKQKSLQAHFFRSYLLLITAIVIIFSVFFYQYTSAILIERETENIIGLTDHMQVQTDQAIRTIDNLSINIGYSNLIMSNLEEYFSETEHDMDQTNRLADLFVAINGTDTQADQINIFNFSGQVIGFGYTNVSGQVDLRAEEWYYPTLALQGHKYVSAPYSTNILSRTNKADIYYISLYRTYYNRFGRQVGIIETMQRCNTVFKPLISLKNSNPDSPAIYVFNESEELVYPFKTDDKEKLNQPEIYLSAIEQNTNHTIFNNPHTEQKELIAYKNSSYSNWTYVTVLPEKTILAPARQLIMLISGMVLILFVITIALSYSMSFRLARPIKQLRNIMRKTELDNLGEQAKLPLDGGYEEVEELNQSFHDLSDKLKVSMDQALFAKHQEVKARTVALQSQINPHFYYNSLSSIIILAENKQCDEVVTLSRNLNSIMRYITKGSSPIVTIKEELEYLEKYLYCMKIRYQSSLKYEISVDPMLYDNPIPKLIIQPLVENALKYGTDCYPPWTVSIKSYFFENDISQAVTDPNSPECFSGWYIEVTDNGPGFSKEALKQFIDLKNDIINTEGLPDIDIDGMGLANVYARWKLHTDNECIFVCDNKDSGGARIRIGRYSK